MSGKKVDQKRLFSLFRDMVDIYSPSGKEEEIVSFLVEYLEGSGLNVMLRPVDETRYNLEISAHRSHPDILFLGHIDTVPAFDIEQYELTEEDGKCYGLGTADMKSGCAAMIEAFVTASKKGFLPDNVMLSLVVGEEENGDGTEALMEAYRFSHALVAEPTNLQPCTSHYGYLELIISLFGYRRHAAMSDMETHAIRTMLRLLLR
nr:M20/M25/M40 family metallo-hydrolase [Spirochaetales bacterium]